MKKLKLKKSQMNISQKIIDYAIWYYLRYYPSKNKLKQKLQEKFGPNSEKGKKYGGISEKEIIFILEEKLKNIIQEKQVCKAKIQSCINKGKNINYIKNNLSQKLFEKNMIEEILIKNFFIEEKSILDKQKIFKQINILKNKGKSKTYIKQKFIENNFDKQIINNFLEEIFEKNKEKENIKFLLQKFNFFENKTKLDFKQKQKILNKIIRKGYKYSDILEIMQ